MNFNQKISFILLFSLAIFVSGCKEKSDNESIPEVQDTLPNAQGSAKNSGNSTEERPILDKKSEESTQIDKFDYTITSKKHIDNNSNNNINISYPCVSGISESADAKWNKIMCPSSDIEDIYKGNTNITEEENYVIKTQTNALISILSTGYIYFEGSAHPNGILRTYNIDVATGKSKRLGDNPDLHKYAKNIFSGNNYKLLGFDNEESYNIFKEYIARTYNNVEELEKDLKNYDINAEDDDFSPSGYSYYEKGKIVVCMPTVHALGDNVQIAIE